jgi:MAE_28990/MAE_18760-like HEPN
MPKLEKFFDDIDGARVRRAKELSEIQRTFGQISGNDMFGVASKAVVVLAYANWEGFYNDCVRTYLQFLVEKGGKVRDQDWMLLVSVFHSEFDSVRDRNHSLEARQVFVKKMQLKLECGFDEVDVKIVEAKSNLNFARLSDNYTMLNFDFANLQRHRNRLDKELVGWRHSVAHGDSPDLSKMDIEAHLSFTSSLLMEVADRFQYSMMERFAS